MSYEEAYAVAANRTKQTKLVHIVRKMQTESEQYFVLMTSVQSELYK